MAKESSKNKNLKKVALTSRYKAVKDEIKKQLRSKSLPLEVRRKLEVKSSELPRNASLVRVVRSCKITGRKRGVFKKFGLCRHKIIELANKGQLPGLTKSSW